MDFFDKLGKKASETYKGAAEKTGKIAKETKLKFAMNDNKDKIKDLYAEIGKKVYENHTSKEIKIDKDLKELCDQIDVLADEIEDYKIQILELKDKKQCPKCKETIEADVNFCPKCGKKQPEKSQEEPKDVEIEIVEEESKEENKEE